MSDAQPVATATPGSWLTGGPLPVPPSPTVRRIPEQHNPVRIVHETPPQLLAEDIERARQARLRPADKSAAAIRTALANIAADTVTVQTRERAWQDREATLLRTGGAIADVQAARSKASDAAVELEQLAAMTASLRESLDRAAATEAAELEALAARVGGCIEQVEVWRKFVTGDYPKLARKIADGLALEAVAEAAMQTLKEAAGRVPGVAVPVPLPLAPWGSAVEPFRFRASLPGTHLVPVARWATPPAVVQY